MQQQLWESSCLLSQTGTTFAKLYNNATAAAAAKSLQSCPTLCDSIDGSPPGCPVPGILQARTLEWVANATSITKLFFFGRNSYFVIKDILFILIWNVGLFFNELILLKLFQFLIW